MLRASTTPQRLLSSTSQHLQPSRHHRQRQIIPVAAGVIHLKLVYAGGNRRAVSQVSKGSGNRSDRGVIDRSEDLTSSQRLTTHGGKIKLCAALDGDAIGYDLISLGFPGVELVSVAT